MKRIFNSLFAVIFLASSMGVFVTTPLFAVAGMNLQQGMVVKARGHNSLYYIGADGKRYVFPNEQTYFSWYDDFSDVKEVNVDDLSKYSLSGNVQYRPGIVLIKIQTDPKVYAVGPNGNLHWIKNEELAKKIYGENWNLLVDDLPVTFFVNYKISTNIENENDFDPDDEEDSTREINDNMRERNVEKTEKKKLQICEKYEKRINHIQKRLARRGVKINGLGDDFLKKCVDDIVISPGDDNQDNKKIIICHTPSGNPSARETIKVGTPAAKAHLSHGDTIGQCDKDKDTKSPIISNVTSTTTVSTATLKWNTNEKSTSKVVYALQSLSTTSNTQVVSDSNLVTSHSFMITGLASSTQYFFRVESMDKSGNVATSSEMMFTTKTPDVTQDITPPIISNITSTSTSATSANIEWMTNEMSSSIVEYATVSLSTSILPITVINNNLVLSHSVNLTGLTASTTYYFRVKSRDASGNTMTSDEKTFITKTLPDTSSPVISGITFTAYSTSTSIMWITNEPSSSKITYATQSLSTATTTLSVFDSTLVSSHSVMLTGLSTSTPYFFKVESRDVAGNNAISSEYTFTTLP